MLQYTNRILNSITSAQWAAFVAIAAAILLWDRGWSVLAMVIRRGHSVSVPLMDKLPLLYAAFILLVTLFTREVGSGGKLAWTPLWSWREVLLHHNLQLLWQILLNLLLFVPLGVLLALNRRWPTKVILVTGFGLSLGIEVCQLVFRLGLFEWDDILHNGLGCTLGVGVVRLVQGIVHMWKQRFDS